MPPEIVTAGLVVIGDEILSGRTKDVNIGATADFCTELGIALTEVRVVSDVEDDIIAAVNALRSRYTYVFTTGGIGPTHDDITADAIADAFATPIAVRADARALLAAHYARAGVELNEARLRMARIPDGASLIDNPISAAPGFSLGHVHVMAGVPNIFAAMVAGLLPTLTGGAPLQSLTLRINRGEGEIAGPLRALAEAHGDLSFGSYPFTKDGIYGANIVIRGADPVRLEAAMAALQGAFPDGIR